MNNFLDFDVKAYEPLQDFEPVPKNQYKVRITDAKLNLTRKGKDEGTGERAIRLDLTITEGKHSGRVLCDFLNIENLSEKARDYARRKLRGISTITGKDDVLSARKDLNCLIGSLIGADVIIDIVNNRKVNKINHYLRPEKVIDSSLMGMQTNDKQSNLDEPNDDIPF